MALPRAVQPPFLNHARLSPGEFLFGLFGLDFLAWETQVNKPYTLSADKASLGHWVKYREESSEYSLKAGSLGSDCILLLFDLQS